jgi:hypothetical protein
MAQCRHKPGHLRPVPLKFSHNPLLSLLLPCHPPVHHLFHGLQGCGYTGCIPSDYWDMGVAVGPLNVPTNTYFPVRLTIRGWSDGSSVSSTLIQHVLTAVAARDPALGVHMCALPSVPVQAAVECARCLRSPLTDNSQGCTHLHCPGG